MTSQGRRSVPFVVALVSVLLALASSCVDPGISTAPAESPVPAPTVVDARVITTIPTEPTAIVATSVPTRTPVPDRTAVPVAATVTVAAPTGTPLADLVGPSQSIETATLVVGGQPFRVEVATEREDLLRGLSGREHLAADAGMLFVFDVERALSFWMKNTLIPLDLIFLDARGTVVSVHTMAPEPGLPDALLTRYTSAGPALFGLEINAGLAEELGVGPGDEIDLTGIAVAVPSAG